MSPPESTLAPEAPPSPENVDWRQIVDLHPEPILLSIDGVYVYANSAAADILGADAPSDLLGRTAFDFVSEEDEGVFRERLAALKRGESTLPIACLSRGLDGRERYIESYSVPVRYDGQPAAQTVVRDVTAQFKTQQALAASEQRYRQLVESAGDIIYRADLQGDFTYVNPVALELARLLPEGTSGYNYIDYVRPDYREQTVAFYRRQIDEKVESTYYEFPLNTGEERWIGQSVQLVRQDGVVVGTQAFGREVTERKRAERTLIEARQVALRSARAKEAFLARVSHAMRTPLNAILGMTHLLLNGADDAPEAPRRETPHRETPHRETPRREAPRRAEYLQAIRGAADNMVTLINTVLDFSSLEAGTIEYRQVQFRLADVVEGVVQAFQYAAAEQGVMLTQIMNPRLPGVVSGDPGRLRQVLHTLLARALNTTPGKRVTLVTSPGDTPGQVAFTLRGGAIVLPEQATEPPYPDPTQHEPTDAAEVVVELDLLLVRRLVEGLGGTLAATPDAAGDVTVVLPLPEAASPDGQLGPPVPTTVLRGRHVLLVEDNRVNQLVARRMMEDWGITVDVAENGQEAVDRIGRGAYDLVLMDLQMPIMDGFEAAQQIRRELGRSPEELPILALTATALVDLSGRLQAAGIDDVVPKPFEPEDLRRRLGQYLPLGDPQLEAEADNEEGGRPDGYTDLSFLEENMHGEFDVIVEVIDLFREQVPEFTRALQESLAAEDWRRIRFTAHKMRSSSATVGAHELADLLATVEGYASRETHLEDIPPLVERAVTVATAASDELKRARERYLKRR